MERLAELPKQVLEEEELALEKAASLADYQPQINQKSKPVEHNEQEAKEKMRSPGTNRDLVQVLVYN